MFTCLEAIRNPMKHIVKTFAIGRTANFMVDKMDCPPTSPTIAADTRDLPILLCRRTNSQRQRHREIEREREEGQPPPLAAPQTNLERERERERVTLAFPHVETKEPGGKRDRGGDSHWGRRCQESGARLPAEAPLGGFIGRTHVPPPASATFQPWRKAQAPSVVQPVSFNA